MVEGFYLSFVFLSLFCELNLKMRSSKNNKIRSYFENSGNSLDENILTVGY